MPRLAVLGHREPRVSCRPAGAVDAEFGEKALDIAWAAGATLLDWQQDVVRAGCARTSSGQWAAREVGLLVSRQNGKTATVEVVELAWMINEPGVHILHTAHEFQTAIESMGRLQNLINSHPLLEDQIDSVRTGNGKEWIRLNNGSEIRYRTRTNAGGRGFSADRLVIDEAMIWSKASQAALRPLLTTARNLQIWFLGSAADAEVHEHCGKWASLRRAAMSEHPPADLLWMEYSAPDPPEPTGDVVADARAREAWRSDPETWAAANPSMGYEVEPGYALVTEEYIEGELNSFRHAVEEWEIERLSVGRWPTDSAARDPVFADWSDLVDTAPRLVGPVCVGVELSADRRRWAVVAAQSTRQRRVHVELGLFAAASNDELVSLLVRLVEAWDPVAVVIDGRSPAAAIEAKLVAAGIEPEKATTSQLAAWSGGFLDDATAGLISHTGQPGLSVAAAAVTKRVLPHGDFVWERTKDGIAAPVLAATLAHGGLLTFAAASSTSRALPSTGAQAGAPAARADVFDPLSAAF